MKSPPLQAQVWGGSRWADLAVLSTQYLKNIYTLADLELVQLGQAGEDLLGDEVHAAVLRPQVQLPLQPRVRADRQSGARTVTCRGNTLDNNVY